MAAGKTITWAGNPSSDIPEFVIGKVTRPLIGATRGTYIDIPGRDGSWFFGERRGRRKLVAECFVQAATIGERRDVILQVADWFDVEIEAALVVSDEPTVFYYATVLEAPDIDEWREVGTFDLTWSISPYSLAIELTEETWTADISDLHSWVPDVEVVTYPVIEITPTNGTLTGFDLTVNGDTLEFTGNIISGSTITINSIAAVVVTGPNTDTELTGAYDTSAVNMAGVTGKFPMLLPATTNTVLFERTGGTATAITVTVAYRKRYRR